MSVFNYSELLAHVGHEVRCVSYGGAPIKGGENHIFFPLPANVAIECMDCSEVLIDFDRDPAETPDPESFANPRADYEQERLGGEYPDMPWESIAK